MTSNDLIAQTLMPFFIALLLHWVPLWRRQNLWFGATVPPGFRTTLEGASALRQYRLSIWATALIASGCAFAGTTQYRPWLVSIGLLGQAVGASVSFAIAHRGVQRFAVTPSGVRSAALATTSEGLPGGLGAVLLPLGMLAATAAYLGANWARLPARFPTHWSIDGTPSRWAMRSWHGVFGPLIVCAVLSVFMIGMAEMIIHASPRGRGTGTEAWTSRFRRANLLLLVIGVWGMSAVMCVISLLPLFSSAGRSPWMVGAVPLILIGTMLPFVIQLVRLTRDASSGSDGTPDRCWKLGQIYYNPDDPAMLVEKRFGLGYTLNFGHRGLVWLVGIAILMFVLICSMISTR